MPFNIQFRGLVCHLTEEKMAVFVKVPKHELRLVVRKRDIVGTPTFESDGVHAKPDPDDPDQQPRTSFKVEGGTLKVEHVTDRKVIQGADFVHNVPSLRQGSSFTTIRPEVRRRKTCHHIAGYLRYPGGVFSVTKYFPNQAIFAGDTPQCIGHTVQLSMTPNGGNVIIRNGSKRITLKRDAVVMFVNVDDTAMNLANTHFHHYYHAIYEGDGSGKVPHLPSDAQPQDCELAKPSQLFPDTDCSNSHEP